MLKGIAVAPGIGLAQALVWPAPVAFDHLPQYTKKPQDELVRFEAAVQAVHAQITASREKTVLHFGDAEAVIFDVYNMMLNDESSLGVPLRQKIEEQLFTAEYAVVMQFGELADQFAQLDDEYMRLRADDVLNLRDQLMNELAGRKAIDHSHLAHPTIIVAHSLSPSDIANLDLSRIEGIVCETGGYNSHISIIARTLGIPTVVGLAEACNQTRSGMLVGLDGLSGEVWLNPTEQDILQLQQRSEAAVSQREAAQRYKGRPTISTDGRRIELSASIFNLAEIDLALQADAEAVGIYHTDYLWVATSSSGTMPIEDEQFEIYRTMLEKMQGKAATVRTFDDGGAGEEFFHNKNEKNPLLGYRGIRMSLGRPSFFRTQLRALLRASAYGPLKVMFPMISSLDELDTALLALESVKDELRREGLPFDKDIPVGVEIEVPAAALLSEAFAQRADFLSINLSGLVQYTLAIDPHNPNLSHLYHLYHPAVLRLIRMVVDAAHNNGISCILCKTVPGINVLLPVLFGLGIDGMAISPAYILSARQVINKRSYAECRNLASQVLALNHTDEVKMALLS